LTNAYEKNLTYLAVKIPVFANSDWLIVTVLYRLSHALPSNSKAPVYTIQPVVKPVVKPVWQTAVSCIQPVIKPVVQPLWQPVVSC